MFKTFKKQFQEHFKSLVKESPYLFITNIENDILWNTYLESFPPEKKQEYNCNCCRSFIKHYGNIVGIKNGELVTIWDFEGLEEFENVIKRMRNLVSESQIRDIFRSTQNMIGTDSNVKLTESGPIVWNHLSLSLPSTVINKSGYSNESLLGTARDNKNIFKRSLEELTKDAIETVLELIAQGSLYRGDEFKGVLTEFLKVKKEYIKLGENSKSSAHTLDNFCWINSVNPGVVTKIRNTSIGTLLIDLSEGRELDKAVEAFERVVAPTNYKRPTALVTKKMIEEAEKTINDLGYSDSLGRRFASAEDVLVTNLLYVNRDTKKKLGVFEELKEDLAINPKSLKKVEEVTINTFLTDILPLAKGIELLLERNHLGNLVSLITAKEKEAPVLFKWNNPFSWCYTNAVTDSIKEQVKAAGGKVEGELRISLSWFNYDDLDLHVIEPGGNKIYYANKLSAFTGGHLDVDMNAGGGNTRKAVENIIFPNRNRISEGKYQVIVNNYFLRETKDVGFIVEVECRGEVFTFEHSKSPLSKGNANVVTLNYSRENGITIEGDVKSSTISTQKWGISTNKFHKVSMIMNSPNFWEGNIGNRHTFFVLEGAKNDEPAVRGFFNEFLKPELEKNKRVFEVLGGKIKVEPADKQLSGVGFSSTQRNSVICKVQGKFERLLKINF